MAEDVETRLRSALRYNADRVQIQQPELRSTRPPGPRNRVWATLAAAACVLGIVGATTIARRAAEHHGGAASAPPYETRQWTLTSVVHAGKVTAVPQNRAARIEFGQPRDSCAGPLPENDACLLMYDSVNTVSAGYRRTEHGFVTTDGASTAIGTIDRNPVREQIVAAIASIPASTVGATVDDERRLHLVVKGYEMIFQTIPRAPTEQPSITDVPALAGRPWMLETVTVAGTTTNVSLLRRSATFDANGTLRLKGEVQDDGTFTARPGGFTTKGLRHAEVSWAEVDHLGQREAVLNAFNAISDAEATNVPSLVAAVVTKSTLVMTAGEYRMTFVRGS